MTSSTGCSASGERLMTFSTSDVAVWNCKDSREVVGARLHLFEQPDIADGDHGLIGKGLQQGDLLFTERVHFGAAKHDRSDALALAQQRHAQMVRVALRRDITGFGKLPLLGRQHVGHVDRHLVDTERPGNPIPVDRPFFQNVRYRSRDARHNRSSSPSFKCTSASSASQSSQALSTIALRTGPTSVGEDAITLRMLLLPV